VRIVTTSDVMILSQVWQRLMFLSLQPMAWVMMPTPEAVPAPVRRPRATRAKQK
jgi:hypothetical protein